MMTKKDYQEVAEIIRCYKDLIDDEFVVEDLVEDFATLFANDNPNFKYDLFRDACLKNIY